MKSYQKQSIFGVLLLLIITASACIKSSITPTKTSTSGSSFTERGNTCNVVTSSEMTSPAGGGGSSTNVYVLLFAGSESNNSDASIEVQFNFNGTTKPSAGTYAVVLDSVNYNATGVLPTNIGANQVAVYVIDKLSTSQNGAIGSIGTDHVNATVAINSSGKYTVTLPTTQLRGYNIDNTNSSNPTVTSLSTTLSGMFTEP